MNTGNKSVQMPHNYHAQRIVVVLGMHRSGTSVITRGLQVLGVALGDHLMVPMPDNNEKGFWEDMDINRLNIELLEALGHDWHTLIPVVPDEMKTPAVTEFKLRAIEILRDRLDRADCFGFKDPRLSRLLPFWMDVFTHMQAKVSYVLACRNPMSVAQSLTRRDGFDLEKGYYLWLEHTLSTLTQTERQTRVVVDYDRLMDDPAGQLQRIAQNLGLNFNPECPAFAEYRAEYLEDNLRHTRYRLEDLHLDNAVPPGVSALYKVLVELAEDNVQYDQPDVKTVISGVSEKFREHYPALRFMHACDERTAVRDRQIASLKQELGERDQQIANLNLHIANLNLHIASIKLEIARILNSTSWKITRPMRMIGSRVKRVLHLQ